MRKLYLILVFVVTVPLVSFGQTETPPECPTIEVTGPAGIFVPGDTIRYVATLKGVVPPDIEYEWTASRFEIIAGQGTSSINILIDPAARSASFTVTLNVKGLPDGCPATFSESASYCALGVPVLLDEFTVPISEIKTTALRAAAAEIEKNPGNQLYIIEYFPAETSLFRVIEKTKRVRDHLVKELKADPAGITIVHAEGPAATRIYRVPPGAENPIP